MPRRGPARSLVGKYDRAPSQLFVNEGDGRFRDISRHNDPFLAARGCGPAWHGDVVTKTARSGTWS